MYEMLQGEEEAVGFFIKGQLTTADIFGLYTPIYSETDKPAETKVVYMFKHVLREIEGELFLKSKF